MWRHWQNNERERERHSFIAHIAGRNGEKGDPHCRNRVKTHKQINMYISLSSLWRDAQDVLEWKESIFLPLKSRMLDLLLNCFFSLIFPIMYISGISDPSFFIMFDTNHKDYRRETEFWFYNHHIQCLIKLNVQHQGSKWNVMYMVSMHIPMRRSLCIYTSAYE